jgi:hypothetical protein
LDLFNFQADMVDLRDIARALSRTPRYRTHTERFYSVAEHCLWLHEWGQKHDWSTQNKLWLLAHDGAEAYTGDLPGPVKDMLSPIWNPMEEGILREVMTVVFKRPPSSGEDWGNPPEEVQDLDVGVRCAEGDVFFPGQDYLPHYAPRLEKQGGTKAEMTRIGINVHSKLTFQAKTLYDAGIAGLGEAYMEATAMTWLKLLQKEMESLPG